MRNNKGVTLLVLIITVVILAILALVTINLTLHKDTITKVRETGNEITSRIESDEEKTESLKDEYKQMDNAIVSWNDKETDDNNTEETETVCTTCNGVGTVRLECEGGTTCPSCEGNGTRTCPGTVRKVSVESSIYLSCCESQSGKYHHVCSECGTIWGANCTNCGVSKSLQRKDSNRKLHFS